MTDRPLECSHCKNKTCVLYHELSFSSKVSCEMCKECPILAKKLHPAIFPKATTSCKTCGTTWESLQMGAYFGCAQCYPTFALLFREKEPLFGKCYLGKQPDSSSLANVEIDHLKQALQEAVQKENYEQAAWIRDQIKDKTS